MKLFQCSQALFLGSLLLFADHVASMMDSIPDGYNVISHQYSQEMWLLPNATIDVDDIVDAAQQLMLAFNSMHDPDDQQIIAVNVSAIEYAEDGAWHAISLVDPDDRRRLGRYKPGKLAYAFQEFIGTCRRCSQLNLGKNNASNRMRKLRGLRPADTIPVDADLIVAQNALIDASGNPTVSAAGSLYTEVSTTTEEAETAATNARIAVAYVEDLELKVRMTIKGIEEVNERLEEQKYDLKKDDRKYKRAKKKSNKGQRKKANKYRARIEIIEDEIKKNESSLKVLQDLKKRLDRDLRKAQKDAEDLENAAEKASLAASEAERKLLEFLEDSRELAASIANTQNEALVDSLAL